MIDIKLLTDQSKLSLRKQCELLGLPRSTYYYTPKGESQENQTIMELMDKHILEEPTAGVLTMQSMLKDLSIIVSYERVRRLMKKAHIRPLYPHRHLTTLGKNKYIHPYLLKDLEITRPNQVWEVDITYIPMRYGFMYLAAVIDVYSRYIVGWGLSNSLDAESSLQVIREAVATHGEPEILNSDQGIQFSCKEYVNYLKEHGIKISMPACRSGRDGRKRQGTGQHLYRTFLADN
jgi:putative transposase